MRKTRVLSIALEPPAEATDRLERNRNAIIEALELAEGYDPDFVCFPEYCLQYASDAPFEIAEPIPGPTTDLVGEYADRIGTAVLVPMIEEDAGSIYNATAFVGADGSVRGAYRKQRPTVSELEGGVIPGESLGLFDTSHGRIGTITCFDVNFDRIGTSLARERPKIVFFPSLFPGGDLLTAWARHYGTYVVKCTPTAAATISPTGAFVGENDDYNIGLTSDLESGGTARLSFAEINTDFEQYHLDFNTEALRDIQRTYPGETEVHKASEEAWVILKSISPKVSIEDMESEFGLENRWAYLDRSIAECEASLEEHGS